MSASKVGALKYFRSALSGTVPDLLEHAIVAMYYAKNQGRSNFQFTESIDAHSLETLMLENGFHQAMPVDL